MLSAQPWRGGNKISLVFELLRKITEPEKEKSLICNANQRFYISLYPRAFDGAGNNVLFTE